MATLNVPDDYPTIAAAVAAADTRDLIVVAAGYGGNETVVVTVDDLYFYAPASVTGIVLQTVGITFIRVDGDSPITIRGSVRDEIIYGNGGANLIDGGGGADDLYGTTGDDIYHVRNARDIVYERAGEGNDTVLAHVTYKLTPGQSVEILGVAPDAGTAALNLTGNELDQRLVGNAGANTLVGGGGADSLYGGAGNDVYGVDNSGDRVFEGIGQGSDRITSSVSFTLEAGQEIEGLFAPSSFGNRVDLVFIGNEFAQALIGGGGNDTLIGGGGADIMRGEAGNDVYGVDNAGDLVFEWAYQGGTDRVSSSVSYTLQAGQSVETLNLVSPSGTETRFLVGNEFAQSVVGNAGYNVLDGGRGADRLTGLAGTDSFQFSTSLGGGNIDRIADFSVVDDTVRLDRTVFTVLGLGTLTANAFKDIANPGAVIDADDRILYNHDNGALYYDINGSAAGGRYHFATLETKPATLTNVDFFVVA